MKMTTRIVLAACLAMPLVACNQQEEAPVEEVLAPLVAPARSDDAGWRTYLQETVIRNMGAITNQPYLYYLPTQDDPDFEAKYKRQLEQARNATARGIVGGNLIAFGSPESARMADIAVASFEDVPAATMQKVKILFIGEQADADRVRAAVEPSGAEYVFVEAR